MRASAGHSFSDRVAAREKVAARTATNHRRRAPLAGRANGAGLHVGSNVPLDVFKRTMERCSFAISRTCSAPMLQSAGRGPPVMRRWQSEFGTARTPSQRWGWQERSHVANTMAPPKAAGIRSKAMIRGGQDFRPAMPPAHRPAPIRKGSRREIMDSRASMCRQFEAPWRRKACPPASGQDHQIATNARDQGSGYGGDGRRGLSDASAWQLTIDHRGPRAGVLHHRFNRGGEQARRRDPRLGVGGRNGWTPGIPAPAFAAEAV